MTFLTLSNEHGEYELAISSVPEESRLAALAPVMTFIEAMSSGCAATQRESRQSRLVRRAFLLCSYMRGRRENQDFLTRSKLFLRDA